MIHEIGYKPTNIKIKENLMTYKMNCYIIGYDPSILQDKIDPHRNTCG